MIKKIVFILVVMFSTSSFAQSSAQMTDQFDSCGLEFTNPEHVESYDTDWFFYRHYVRSRRNAKLEMNVLSSAMRCRFLQSYFLNLYNYYVSDEAVIKIWFYLGKHPDYVPCHWITHRDLIEFYTENQFIFNQIIDVTNHGKIELELDKKETCEFLKSAMVNFELAYKAKSTNSGGGGGT